MVLLPNRAHPSVVRLNRLLELNCGPLVWWCCLFSNSNGLQGYKCCSGRNNNDPIPLVKFVNITCSLTLPVVQYLSTTSPLPHAQVEWRNTGDLTMACQNPHSWGHYLMSIPWSDPGGGLWGLKPPPFNLMIFIILSTVVHIVT